MLDKFRLKQQKLRTQITNYKNVIVALSGGVDSSLLAYLCLKILGAENMRAVTGLSASLPSEEKTSILSFVERYKIPHQCVNTRELENPLYIKNAPDRCSYCKQELFENLKKIRSKHQNETIVDGTHIDDLKGHRPSLQIMKTLNIASPFLELGFNKQEIRQWAKEEGLSQATRLPSPCLSSRIAYGTDVTAQKLQQVERAEAALKKIGYTKLRVRHHQHIARIEIPVADFGKILQDHQQITQIVKDAGFTFVTMDLQGLRSGSLLEVLPNA